MSVVDPVVTATSVTVLVVTMVMYVVDFIADQRRESRNHKERMNGDSK